MATRDPDDGVTVLGGMRAWVKGALAGALGAQVAGACLHLTGGSVALGLLNLATAACGGVAIAAVLRQRIELHPGELVALSLRGRRRIPYHLIDNVTGNEKSSITWSTRVVLNLHDGTSFTLPATHEQPRDVRDAVLAAMARAR